MCTNFIYSLSYRAELAPRYITRTSDKTRELANVVKLE